MLAITDGTAAGLPAGGTVCSATKPFHRNGRVLRDGTLAGSVLTMDGAFRMLVERAGLSLVDAATMCATTPARELGFVGYGVWPRQCRRRGDSGPTVVGCADVRRTACALARKSEVSSLKSSDVSESLTSDVCQTSGFRFQTFESICAGSRSRLIWHATSGMSWRSRHLLHPRCLGSAGYERAGFMHDSVSSSGSVRATPGRITSALLTVA